ncbi:zinc finger, CCHC-type [Artemisia annua]|uniref:Zinc finger, CCHC-type n=1 Tax=Artemisia annua TaxID=35608 RepID=A0A2U1KJ75_ARTAN|nr:zinc finger, CCHC-type [Artemisia annua]
MKKQRHLSSFAPPTPPFSSMSYASLFNTKALSSPLDYGKLVSSRESHIPTSFSECALNSIVTIAVWRSEIQDNYILVSLWFSHVYEKDQSVLGCKFYHLEEALPEAPAANATAAVRNAYTRRCNEQQEVACLMLASMIPELQKNLENLAAFDMLRELKVMFEQQAEQELFDTVKSFHACKQEEGQSVSSYVMKMKGYLDQMDRLGYPMPQILGVSLILTSLSKDYDQFVQNYNMHSMGKTIAELHNMLKLAEKGMPKKAPVVLAINKGRIQKKNKGKPLAPGKGQGKGKAQLAQLAYAPKPKIPPPAKKEHPAKDTVCHHCGVVGHWRRNCAAYLEGLKKNKASGASTSGNST